MRASSIVTAVTMALVLGVAPCAAQMPTPQPDGSGLRLELIGYGAAITLPAGYVFDAGGEGAPTGPLHAWSPFFDESRMRAVLPTEGDPPKVGAHCGLIAFSQARCAARPVDLATEVGIGLETVRLPAGEALAQHSEYEATVGGAYHQSVYWLTDGTDIYAVWCDGPQRPTDDWRSIAETFEYPPRPHHAEAPTADSDLLGGVRELFSMHGGIGLGGPPWPEDYWSDWIAYNRRDIEDRLGADWADGPELAAMEEHFGAPLEPMDYEGHFAYPYRRSSDGNMLSVDGIRMPGLGADDVLDGLIAWAEVEWARDEAGAAAYEDFPMAGRDVWRVTFADTDAVEYLYALGDSAIRVHGLDEETDHHAMRLFEALPCHHLASRDNYDEWMWERILPLPTSAPKSEAPNEGP